MKSEYVNSAENVVHQLASVLSTMRIQQTLSEKKFVALLRKEVVIPCSIFSEQLSSLETIVIYLRDYLHLKNKDVADVLNRDCRAVSRTYGVGKRKQTLSFSITNFSSSFPVRILASRKNSVLETLVMYLNKQQKKSLHDIANILHRDYKTIWTVRMRANK